MSNTDSIYPFILYCIPVVSALVCLTIFSLDYTPQKKDTDKQIRGALIGYFVTVAFNWISILIGIYRTDIFIWLLGLRYSSFCITQVLFYQLIYEMTRLPDDKPFNWRHFLPPLVLGVILTGWSWFIPKEALIEVAIMMGNPVNGYEVFSKFAFSHHHVRFLYGLIYTALSLKRFYIYRQEVVNYSSQLYETGLGWLKLFILLSAILLIAPTISIFFDKRKLIYMWIIYVPVFALIIQHVLLLYNVIARNFIVFIGPESKKDEPLHEKKEGTVAGYLPRKKEFEKYMSEKKPYLKTDLKIMEMAADLGINRTYLSVFINQYYGMNFSTFINERRLAELKELRKNPAHASKTNLEIILMAGFGSYQSYLRTKKKHDNQSLLSPD